MRCKPGDLAVIVKSDDFTANLGKVVRVNGPGCCGDWDCDSLGQVLLGYDAENGLPGAAVSGCGFSVEFDDDELRPLRPDAGADETLAWAGLPTPVREVETSPVATGTRGFE